MQTEQFDLVIFDCDGVLVDSEPIANRVFAQMLGELGLKIGIEEMYERFVGRSMSHCMKLVADKLGRAPPDGFVARLQKRTFAAFQRELQAIPGITDALDEIDLPVCVASSGELEKMRVTLGLTGLLPRFEGRLFSVTEVPRGKPAPDVYLHAAATLKVEPVRCAVIEDTPVGAQAGVAAGMTVFGYCAHTSPDKLIDAGAQRTFADMRRLPSLLSRTT